MSKMFNVTFRRNVEQEVIVSVNAENEESAQLLARREIATKLQDWDHVRQEEAEHVQTEEQ